MRSNRTLKGYYDTINSRFFDGELPSNVCVRWLDDSDIEEDEKCEEKYNGFCFAIKDDCHHCAAIVLNTELKADKGRLLSVLAHECIHIRLNFRDDHGPAFERERLKLSDKGFFKKGAMLPGFTLF
jgi:hypothetical protein